MREGVVVQDRSGAIVQANEAAERILGLRLADMAGRTSTDPRWRAEREDGSTFPGEAHPSMVSLATGRPVRGVLMAVHRPDGSRTLIEINAEPICATGETTPGHVVTTFIDVTERVDFLAMCDNEVVAVARLRNRRFVWVNRAMERLFGYRAEELVGQSTRLLYPDDLSFERTGDQIHADVASSGSFRTQAQQVRKDGSLVWVDAHGVRIEGTSDFIAFFTDLTPIRAAQARVIEANRVEGVARLAGGVAHELNNKLQNVIGLSELSATEPGLSPRVADDLAQIRESARHAAEVTRQLMAYARKEPSFPQVLDTASAISARIALLAASLPERVSIAGDVDDGVWPVMVDGSQLTEVLANLVTNAREAMDDAGPVVVSARNVLVDAARAARRVEARTGDFVEVVVRDAGRGMTPEVLQRAQEPFFTTKPFGRNNGLGLSTVVGIVAQHGGWVEIESEPARGTSVALLFPRASGSQTSATGTQNSEVRSQRSDI